MELSVANGTWLSNSESSVEDDDDLPDDYDYEESATRYDLADLVPTATVYGSTLLLGLVGNLLIVYTVARFQRMRSISNIFLASLATADLLIVLLCIPVKFGQLFSYTWTLGEFGCKFILYVQHVSMICSVLNLTFLSIERLENIHCLFVVRVLSIGRTCLSQGSSGGLTSSNPERSSSTTSTFETMGLHRTAYWCMRDEDNPTTWRSFEIYMLILVLCVPALVMSYTYSKICFQLWMHRTAKPSRADEDTVRQVIKMLILVVALFVICWAPILILNVLTAFGGVTTLNYSYLKPLRTTFHLLSYMNSCVNPLVYGFMSKSFRNSFKDALLGCLRPNRSQFVARGTTRLSRTRTTSVSIGRSTYVT
ncbi:G protein-coupled receptor, putative [Ixodes scapularis]|uniref:G protein-coupled receptor, putative n=1 Tax=Ixodes scapularis TaxID=6945 RepID=B7Q4D1_IXOSC|nr:G protein-coupled receptor, putative [Ixodes scapularis]|eukprot:XP_002400244.1 G protein-coupled receptor, putative [Ixodes scapularis]